MTFTKVLSAKLLLESSYADYTSALMLIVCLAGLILFIRWLIKSDFGRNSLAQCTFRINFLPYYFPFAVIIGWLILSLLASSLVRALASDLPDWQQKFIFFLLLIVNEVIIIIAVLVAARRYFLEGLEGFGFKIRQIWQDIAAAAGYFIATWPLVIAAIYMIIFAGRFIQGPDFELQQNEGLAIILESQQPALKILVIFFATVLTPVFEEVIFRGLLQTYLRDLGYSPWQAIFVVSVVFSIFHPWMHFPALMVLAICMGYAYEKSGSLIRPILVHFFFNSAMIAFALTQQ